MESNAMLYSVLKVLGVNYTIKPGGFYVTNIDSEYFGYFNPLDNNEEAFQLIADFNLILGVYNNYASVFVPKAKKEGIEAAANKIAEEVKEKFGVHVLVIEEEPEPEEFLCWFHETKGDVAAALRRAIVKAVASKENK